MGNVRRRVTPEDRLRIVQLIEDDRRDPQLVADVFGVSRSSVYEWLRRYREGGPEALHAQAPLGRPVVIPDHEARRLYSLIRNHEPREFGFGAALWTRSMVGLLIKRELDVELSQPTVVKFLSQVGLHIAKHSSTSDDTTGLARYVDRVVRARVTRAAATLMFGTVTRLGDARGTDWHGRDHLLSAVDGRGKARFSVSSTQPDTGRLITFGAGLVHDCPAPTYVVLRAAPWCDTEAARTFVSTTHGRLGIFVVTDKETNTHTTEFWGR